MKYDDVLADFDSLGRSADRPAKDAARLVRFAAAIEHLSRRTERHAGAARRWEAAYLNWRLTGGPQKAFAASEELCRAHPHLSGAIIIL